ncbi:MAG: NAD-dependent epimerase/dehydratase family protein [Candidatus Helarchaeota archaeon]
MRILVTGGAGFIGSNVVEALVRENHEVLALDNFFLGRRENLSDVWDEIQFHQGDIQDSKLVDKLVKGCDIVFHEAAYSSAPMFDNDPKPGMNININGFINVLNAARDFNVKRVIFAATSRSYSGVRPPHKEEMQLRPSNFYTLSIFTREILAKLYWQKWRVESVGLRFFSIYGPHERSKGKFANVITQFLWDIKEKRSPIIYGDGSQTRDFTFVSDAVQASLLAMNSHKIMKGEIFNVGTGRATSFNQIIEKINEILGTNIQAKKIENPIANYVKHTLADISKIKKILGYKSRVSLGDGIKKLVEVYE